MREERHEDKGGPLDGRYELYREEKSALQAASFPNFFREGGQRHCADAGQNNPLRKKAQHHRALTKPHRLNIQYFAENEEWQRFADLSQNRCRAIINSKGDDVAPLAEQRPEYRPVAPKVKTKERSRPRGYHAGPGQAHVAETQDGKTNARNGVCGRGRNSDERDRFKRHLPAQKCKNRLHEWAGQVAKRGDEEISLKIWRAEISRQRSGQDGERSGQDERHDKADGNGGPNVLGAQLFLLNEVRAPAEGAYRFRDSKNSGSKRRDTVLSRRQQPRHNYRCDEINRHHDVTTGGGPQEGASYPHHRKTFAILTMVRLGWRNLQFV